MKNEIREAYERMNPPKEARERMMKNIMKKQNRREGFFTPAPGPERWWTAIPAALALVAVLVIGWKFLIPGVEGPMTDDPVVTANPATDPARIDTYHTIGGVDWNSVPDMYWDILTKYQLAVRDGWDREKWESEGLNGYIYSSVKDINSLGYSLIDLNDDGTQELLISNGSKIYDLRYLSEGSVYSALQIAQDAQDKDVHLLEGNLLYSMESDSFGVTYHIWHLGPDGLGMLNLVCDKVVIYTQDGTWYAGPNDKDAVKVSETEAKAVLESYHPVAIPVTYFVAEPAQNSDTIPQGYAHVLGKYTRAMEEGWSVEEYMQNDICYVLGIQGSIEDYGYAFLDLDGNGVEELIITDGELIYDMFTLLEDGGAGHILSAGERLRYFLCEDNVIGYRGSGGAANTVLEYYRLENGMDLVTEVCLEFDTDTWYRYESGGHDDLHPGPMVAITEDDVRHIQDAYQAVEIIYQSFLRPEAEKTDDTSNTLPEGFAHVIEKYEKATTEDWTKEQYMQNDISFLVASKDIYWQYGYAQVDLNGDGSNELIITDGEEIYDLYILMEDGGAGHIISATDERSYFLCKDNIIGCQSLGTESTSWDYSRLLAGGDSEIVMYVQKNGDNWYKIEGRSDAVEAISHEEADELIGGTYWRVEIPFQTILRLEPAEELIYPRTYVQLLREMMGEYSGVATMYVAFADVTGDGYEEMLLGLGPQSYGSFGHVYSVLYGGVSEILTYGSDIDFTLCKDGIICHHQADKPFGNYTFISLKGGEYKILENFAYDEDEKSWARTIDGTKEYISDAEMQSALDSYGSVSLDWVPVLEAIAG